LRQAVIIGERAHYPRCAGSLRDPTISEITAGLPRVWATAT
jgi:hypothetical protein